MCQYFQHEILTCLRRCSQDDFFGAHLQKTGRFEGFGSDAPGGRSPSTGSSGLPSRESTPQLGVAPRSTMEGGRISPAARVPSPAVRVASPASRSTPVPVKAPVPVAATHAKKKSEDDWDEW